MKKLLLIIISSLLFSLLVPTSAFAAQPGGQTNQTNNSTQSKCSTISYDDSHFYVILEEPISEEGFLCFRQCTQVKNTDGGPPSTKCEYLDECTTNPTTGNKIISCQRIQVLESRSGAELIYTYVGTIYKWAAGVIGIVCVLIIVFSGIQIMVAGGNSDAIGESKKHIVQSLSGLAVLLLSGLILYSINPTFFV